MNESLSDKEVQFYSGENYPVITNKDLQFARNISEVFKDKKGVILLYETSPGVGHWTCLIQHEKRKVLEFFDSYGFKPDDEKEWIPANMWIGSVLSKLLYNSALQGWKIEYNEMRLQRMGKKVATCGRWVAIRLRTRNIPLEAFQEVFQDIPANKRDQAILNITNSIS